MGGEMSGWIQLYATCDLRWHLFCIGVKRCWFWIKVPLKEILHKIILIIKATVTNLHTVAYEGRLCDVFVDYNLKKQERSSWYESVSWFCILTLWQLHDPHADSRHQISNCIFSDGVVGQPWQDREKAHQEAFHPGSRAPGETYAKTSRMSLYTNAENTKPSF